MDMSIFSATSENSAFFKTVAVATLRLRCMIADRRSRGARESGRPHISSALSATRARTRPDHCVASADRRRHHGAESAKTMDQHLGLRPSSMIDDHAGSARHGNAAEFFPSSQTAPCRIALGSFADGRRPASFISSPYASEGAVLGGNDPQRNLRDRCDHLPGCRSRRRADLNGVRLHSCDGRELVRLERTLRPSLRRDHRSTASTTHVRPHQRSQSALINTITSARPGPTCQCPQELLRRRSSGSSPGSRRARSP